VGTSFVQDHVRTEPRDDAPRVESRAWSVVQAINLALLATPLAALALLGYRQRWVSEDAYISLRVAQQIIAGHGPVYNPGERVEAHTNPLWVAILALFGALGADMPRLSVWLGLLLSTAGLLAAMVAAALLARRLAAGDGPRTPVVLLPAGALIFAAVPVVWDFATSGLETGLTFAWLGGAFLLLVRCGVADPPTGRWWLGTAFTIGLGPLVRPDLAIFSAGFLAALLYLRVPRRDPREIARSALLLGAAAGTVPFAYQIFRMGYYAALTPNTALAKEAGSARWDQGWIYFTDLIQTYALWLPLAILLVWCAAHVRSALGRRDLTAAVLLATPVATASLHALYVVRVGGDFMHGRLLLPALFAALMPFAVVRFQAFFPTRLSVALLGLASVVLGFWFMSTATDVHTPVLSDDGYLDIVDERAFYVRSTDHPNPVTVEDYGWDSFPALEYAGSIRDRADAQPRIFALEDSEFPVAEWVHPGVRLVTPFRHIGVFGYAVGSDIFVVDQLGLADPIGSRIHIEERRRPGHEKFLPIIWAIARFSEAEAGDIVFPGLEDARSAMQCGDLERLLAAVSDPLTAGRFLENMRLSWSFHSLRVPQNPADARRELCAS
jgi:arabinofuranosyltransferase